MIKTADPSTQNIFATFDAKAQVASMPKDEHVVCVI